MSCCFWIFVISIICLETKVLFCFNKKKSKKKSVKLQAKLTSEVLVCSAGSLAHDKRVCNPVTMTTHMWAPNKHIASTFSRKCRLLHIHRHRRNPTHKNTPSKRRARQLEFSRVPTYSSPTGSNQKREKIPFTP